MIILKTIPIVLITFIVLFKCAHAAQPLRLAIFYKPSRNALTQRIISEAYNNLNINIEFIHLPAERSLWLVDKGIIDGETARIAGLNKTYHNLLMIKVPIEVISLYAYVRKDMDMNFTVKGWQSVRPYRSAYLRGGKAVERNLKDAHIESVFTLEQAFSMLEHHRVDVVIEKANQATHYPNIKMLKKPIYSFLVYHYIHKKHINLISPLERILKKIITNRKIAELKYELAHKPQK